MQSESVLSPDSILTATVTTKQAPECTRLGYAGVTMALQPHLYEAEPDVLHSPEPLTAHTDSESAVKAYTNTFGAIRRRLGDHV